MKRASPRGRCSTGAATTGAATTGAATTGAATTGAATTGAATTGAATFATSIRAAPIRSASTLTALLIVVLLLPADASAASRPRYGGALAVGHVPAARAESPALRDAPLEASLLLTEAAPLCTLSPSGPRALLALSIETIDRQRLRITLRPALRSPRHGVLDAAAVARTLEAAARAPSPYRGLLAPILRPTRPAIEVTGPLTLELSLSHPWPELASSLCHPVLSVLTTKEDGLGPFQRSDDATRLAQLAFPGGRPFIDRLGIGAYDERGLLRAFGLGRIQVGVGAAGVPTSPHRSAEGPKLFATYLAFSPARVGPHFRAALEAAVDRTDLARYFARGPAEPMTELLPSSHFGGSTAPTHARPAPSTVTPKPGSPPRELTLLYDETLPDHRTLAERIQVKLHAEGFRLSLQPRSREALRRDSASADLALQSVLLPPDPPSALGVLLTLAREDATLTRELGPIGRIDDPAARHDAARVRARALAGTLPLIPLVTQGLSAFSAPNVEGLSFSPSGTVALDALSLSP